MDTLSRIMARVKVCEHPHPILGTFCWEWIGLKDKDGYGKISVRKKSWRVHRAMFAVKNGEIPKGACVLHHCDNSSCCNPVHLFLGTIAINNRDRAAKGRSAKGDNHWTRKFPEKVKRGDQNGAAMHPDKILRGEDHPHAILTTKIVLGMMALRGKIKPKDVAKKLGVSWGAVRDVFGGRIWSHVTGIPKSR